MPRIRILDSPDPSLLRDINDAVNDPEIGKELLSEQLAEKGILPMYGMPTRQRNLYHNKGGRGQIDRVQDLAITEFAPGAYKTKDKRIYEPIGFTPDFRYEGDRYLIPDKDPLGGLTWMKLCGELRKSRNPKSRTCKRKSTTL